MSNPNRAPSDQLTPKPRKKPRTRAVIAGVGVVASIAGGVKYQQDQSAQNAKIEALQKDNRAKTGEIEDLANQKKALDQRLQRVSNIMGNLTKVNPKYIEGGGLSSVDKLPGIGKEVNPEFKELLQNSTVKLGRRLKTTPSQGYQEWCTGVKMTMGNSTYIMSAAHCFEDALPQKGGGMATKIPAALNVTAKSAYDYVVFDPYAEAVNNRAPQTPLALVKSVAMDVSGNSDIALMKVEPTPDVSVAGRSFEDISSIPESRFIKKGDNSLAGQGVGLYGIPDSSGDVPVVGDGIYLGQFDNFSQAGFLNETRAYVVINPKNPYSDACDYGASGSVSALASGQFTGPLSNRDNFGYGSPDSAIQPDDSVNGQKMRLIIEQETHLDLENYITVCSFTVPQPDAFSNVRQVVENPNDIPYTNFVK